MTVYYSHLKISPILYFMLCFRVSSTNPFTVAVADPPHKLWFMACTVLKELNVFLCEYWPVCGDLWMRYVWTCSDAQVINKWSGTIYRFDYIVGLIASYQLQLNKNTSTVSVYTLIWVQGCYGYSGCNNISSVFVSTYLLYYVFILFYIVSCTVQQRIVTR